MGTTLPRSSENSERPNSPESPLLLHLFSSCSSSSVPFSKAYNIPGNPEILRGERALGCSHEKWCVGSHFILYLTDLEGRQTLCACVLSFICSTNIYPAPLDTEPGAEGTTVTEERLGKWLTSGSNLEPRFPVLQLGQTFIITQSGEKNMGWCPRSLEETRMPGIFSCCASHRRERDKTQESGLRWLFVKRPWARPLDSCQFHIHRIALSWASGVVL